jgi:glycosyltransferase involved in cell wall biosynthesis
MDKGNPPLISVVMPVYNAEKYLEKAVASILGQSCVDFELIMVDDGSTDGSSAMLESFRQKDARVIVQKHPQNQGIAVALNSGLALARGRYIARMDADDISLPDRFEKQVAFLEKHPEIDILGSAVQLIDQRGEKIGTLSAPLGDLAIRWSGLFSSSFLHPTVMLRRSVIVEHNIHYRVPMDQSEDHDFFTQLLEHAHGANLAERLLLYRIHSSSVTSYYNRKNLNRKSGLIHANLRRYFPGLEISQDQAELVSSSLRGTTSSWTKRAQAADIYLRVWQAFAESYTPAPDFNILRANVVMVAAKMALFPPFQPGWRKVIRNINNIEPTWFLTFLGKFPEMVSTKIYSWRILKSRS